MLALLFKKQVIFSLSLSVSLSIFPSLFFERNGNELLLVPYLDHNIGWQLSCLSAQQLQQVQPVRLGWKEPDHEMPNQLMVDQFDCVREQMRMNALARQLSLGEMRVSSSVYVPVCVRASGKECRVS